MIKGVVFDFGGVLYGTPLGQVARLERRAGLPPGKLSRVLDESGSKGAWGRFERGEIDLKGFVQEMGAELDRHDISVEVSALIELSGGSFNTPLLQYIKDELRGKYKTAVITNNFQIPAHKEPLWTISGLFDLVVESSIVGCRKPDPKIYDYTFTSLEIDPEEIVYIDDIGANLRYPRSLGILTIKAEGDLDLVAQVRRVLTDLN
ncbi:HAD family hydrolase [Ferrithrix thermotolerans]|nr:HAD family phosphatase [Ferrithrix thermotolerans]